jgi:iron-sulfur cluster repair protein YtfE (RIC family)
MPAIGGAVAILMASRVLPPLMGRLIGAARDPFKALADDHKRVLSMLDKICDLSDDQYPARRMLLLAIKRSLTAHALAEEDVVYPLLKMQAGKESDARQLYMEHAEIKMHLNKLESLPKGDAAFRPTAHALRDLVAHHARQEEEVDFPMLQRVLDQAALTKLAGDIGREKALVL